MKLKRIGVFGGTFSPPHNGHLQLAADIKKEFNLDCVLFVPAKDHIFKPDILPLEIRCKLLEVITAFARLDLLPLIQRHEFYHTDIEGKIKGESNSYDMLSLLEEKMYADLYFIIGTDAFMHIERWKNWRQLIDKTNFIIVNRHDYHAWTEWNRLPLDYRDEFRIQNVGNPGVYFKHQKTGHTVQRSNIDTLNISSTNIRNRILNGESIKYLVPEKVQNRIEELNLYKDKPTRE